MCIGAAEACIGATQVGTSDQETEGIRITVPVAFGMTPATRIGKLVVGGGMSGMTIGNPAIGNPAIGNPITWAMGVAIDIIRGMNIELRFQPPSPSP